MAALSRQRTLTAFIPVLAGRDEVLEALLEGRRAELCAGFARVSTLHSACFLLLPALGDAPKGRTTTLIFESTFDGEDDAFFAALFAELGGLAPIFECCEGWRPPRSRGELAGFFRTHWLPAAASYRAHPGLTLSRIRADAELRAAVSQVLDEQRAELAALASSDLARRVRELVSARHPALALDETTTTRGARERAPSPVLLRHAPALAYTWLRALVHDLSDALGALWHDVRPSPPALTLAGPPWAPGDALGRPFACVAVLKPGRFRRTAVRLALRVAGELAETLESRPSGPAIDQLFSARWTLLSDGRLVLLTSYEGSFEAILGVCSRRASRVLTMLWSNVRDFPASLAWTLGGARDALRTKRWLRARELPASLWFSAYPSLGSAEVRDNAELRELLGGELDEPRARRLLRLVKD